MTSLLYSFTGLILFAFGLCALIACSHPLRKTLGVNIMSSGVFLFLVATSYRPGGLGIDPVPHAMVLTGIVVSVSATAVALILASRVQKASCLSLHAENTGTAEEETSGV
jgi:multicomponent Na+:H+ antiporter subunit C